MTYFIFDAERLRDLQRMDTTADTPEQARAEAEAMAKRWGCRVYVLAVAGEVEGTVEPRWTRELAQAPCN